MASSTGSLLTRQPWKGLYVLIVAALVTARLPFWLIYYIPRALRQHPKWSFRQALMVQLLKTVSYHFTVIEMRTPLSIEPGLDKQCFVTVHPTTPERYVDILNDKQARPEKVGGTWYPDAYEVGDQQDVVLHFHGGAFVLGTGRADDAGFAARMLHKHSNAKIFMPQYRLSSNPGGKFPAALQDAVSAYQHLLDAGVPPSKIVVSGDSAGANLALALLRYISEHEDLFPSPAAAWLWSPWVDVARAADSKTYERHRNYGTDYVVGRFGAWGARAYVPDSISASHPYISPMDHPFRCRTPLWIQTGGLEVLYDDDVQLADHLKAVEGNKVELSVEPYAPHDIILLGDKLGFVVEAERATKKAVEFLRHERLGS